MKRFSELFTSLSRTDNMFDAVVGIDIGSSSIKVVELEQKRGTLSLSTYGELQLGPYADKALGESVQLSPKDEQAALVDVIRESAVTGRDAVFAMPLASSFVTNVTVDAPANSDLAAMVRVEARKVIPSSLSEVTLDWAEVEAPLKKKGDTDNIHNILVAAIQNSALDRFKVLMKFAGLKNPPTEIECFSSIRSLLHTGEDDVAIIDIGATSAKLYIVRAGQLMRMHRVRMGGAVVTKAVAEQQQIDFEDVEQNKLTMTRDDEQFEQYQQAHQQSYQRGFREFAQVLAEYESKTGVTISQVYLSGGGAVFPGMEKFAQSVLNHNVQLANPFAKVSYPAFMEDTMRRIGPSFSVALGAALRQFE